MRSTYKQFYYINRGRVKADGTTSIFCRITIDGKVSAIATGLYCAPEEWDTKKGEANSAEKQKKLTRIKIRRTGNEQRDNNYQRERNGIHADRYCMDNHAGNCRHV